MSPFADSASSMDNLAQEVGVVELQPQLEPAPIEKQSENEKREVIRVQADTLDELVNEAGEVSILNSQLQQIMESIFI